jgi:cytochrome c oxidase cbb3-type subunit IV
MDINDLRSVTTLISFLTFVGIIWWAYAKGNRQRFDEAANLPFADGDDDGEASRTPHAR